MPIHINDHDINWNVILVYLSNKVFAGENGTTIAPDHSDVDGFTVFMERYKKGLGIERAAVEGLK